MDQFEAGYNFAPGDTVWYYDANPATAGFKEGSCYQVEIKIFRTATGTVNSKKLSYLILLNGSSTTLRVTESQLFIQTGGGLVPGPTTPRYNALYRFEPTNNVWVVDRDNNGVRYGEVYQTELKINKNLADALTFSMKTSYYVSFLEDQGTTIADDADVFYDAFTAWAELGIVIGVTPDPVPTDPTDPTSGSNTTLVSKRNTSGEILYRGTPVYLKQIDGSVGLVSSDITTRTFLGFVYDLSIGVNAVGRIITEGALTATSQEWQNTIEEINNGLVQGSDYFISTVPGKLTRIPPTLEDGDIYSKKIAYASSEFDLDIRMYPTIKL